MIKKSIRGLVKWALAGNDRYEGEKWAQDTAVPVGRLDNNLRDKQDALNITVFSASGGKVVQVNTYDIRLDRTQSSLYIVTDGENLGEELSQIITRESLTR